MPSTALKNFNDRLKAIDELFEAHTALTHFRRAEGASRRITGSDLADLASVINKVVTLARIGRHTEVYALNAAAAALLSGHLKGFIADLYEESAKALLSGHVVSITAMIESAPKQSAINSDHIKNLFRTIGFDDVLSELSWPGMTSTSFGVCLMKFNRLQTDICRDTGRRVTKKEVESYLEIFRSFSINLDQWLQVQIRTKSGSPPWSSISDDSLP